MSDINWQIPKRKQNFWIGKRYLLIIDGILHIGEFDVETDGVGYWTLDEDRIIHLPVKLEKFALIDELSVRQVHEKTAETQEK